MVKSGARVRRAVVVLGLVASVLLGVMPAGAAPGEVAIFPGTPEGLVHQTPFQMTATPDGNVWFTFWDHADGAIGRLDPRTNAVLYRRTSEMPGVGPEGGLPNGITYDPTTNQVWFTLEQDDRIGSINLDGSGARTWSTDSGSDDTDPVNIAAGSDGQIYFTSIRQGTVKRFDPVTETVSAPLGDFTGRRPDGIVRGPDGAIWVVAEGTPGGAAGGVYRIPPGGSPAAVYAPGGSFSPGQVEFGPDGNLWVSLHADRAVARITPAGELVETIDLAALGVIEPGGLAFSPSDGSMWVANRGSNASIQTPDSGIVRISWPARALTLFNAQTSTAMSMLGNYNDVATGTDGHVYFVAAYGRSVGLITTAAPPPVLPPGQPGTVGSGGGATTPGGQGYRFVAADGGVFTFGAHGFHGSAVGRTESGVVGMQATGSTAGYWVVNESGHVFAFGDAPHFGDLSGVALAAPVIGITRTATGKGYWLVAADGGIFSFGDAAFHGSTGDLVLNQPIVGIIPTRHGAGYWLVARDGGIFSFGDAVFHGSTGDLVLNQPIVGGAPTPGDGYWFVAADGGIFSFGDAVFHGSTGDLVLNQPIVAFAVTPSGQGYWLTARDGGVFSFGDAAFHGSTGHLVLNQPIVGAA